MREDSQNDKIDARRLTELLRIDHLAPVYCGEHGLRTLKELVRSYLILAQALHSILIFASNRPASFCEAFQAFPVFLLLCRVPGKLLCFANVKF